MTYLLVGIHFLSKVLYVKYKMNPEHVVTLSFFGLD